MSLPLSLNDVKQFTCDSAKMHAEFADDCMGQGLNSLSPLSDEQQQDLIDEEYLTTIRAAQQAEWAHLLAVESYKGLDGQYAYDDPYRHMRELKASLAAYNAEFNTKAE